MKREGSVADIESWTVQQSRELYSIENWGDGYFNINEKGNIKVLPKGNGGPGLDLLELVEESKQKYGHLPILFRFNDILRHRVERIYEAFGAAIAESSYCGKYLPAYPVKVNQQKDVIEVLRTTGERFSLGLEVGSKPELLAVLGIHQDPLALLLCNGYKDREYVELALMGQKVGRRPIIIVEKFSELKLILDTAEELGVEPSIGLRLRTAGKGSGRWERSGGDRSKFGLSVGEILKAVELLEASGKNHYLKLIHFHIGSQLTAISSLRPGIREAAQVYAQLRPRCPELQFLDVGGGLGIDYDGSKTAFESSMNYTLEEYSRDVVSTIEEICEQSEVSRPDIITESGRALTAHHSVLVFDVLGVANTFTGYCDPEEILEKSEQTKVLNMAKLLLSVTAKNCQETLHEAFGLRADILSQFNLGQIKIEDRARADSCYWALLQKISKHSSELHYVPEDLEKLPAVLTDTYFCNMSVFQSIPDHWAIGQIFPVTPVSRLTERPNKQVVLGDISCDSDGKIDKFADLKDVKRYLMAHNLNEGEPYYFAVFLVGAYQEILGDLHNLFGDTNAVHIELNDDGTAGFSSFVAGDTIEEVLKYVEFEKEDLKAKWESSVKKSLADGNIEQRESERLIKKYDQAFQSYTYLDGQG